MKDEYIYIPITILIVVLAFWIMPSIREWWGQPAPVESTETEWCLIEELPPSGGSWDQQHAGQYEYQVIQTQSGFKIFQRCAKIE